LRARKRRGRARASWKAVHHWTAPGNRPLERTAASRTQRPHSPGSGVCPMARSQQSCRTNRGRQHSKGSGYKRGTWRCSMSLPNLLHQPSLLARGREAMGPNAAAVTRLTQLYDVSQSFNSTIGILRTGSNYFNRTASVMDVESCSSGWLTVRRCFCYSAIGRYRRELIGPRRN